MAFLRKQTPVVLNTINRILEGFVKDEQIKISEKSEVIKEISIVNNSHHCYDMTIMGIDNEGLSLVRSIKIEQSEIEDVFKNLSIFNQLQKLKISIRKKYCCKFYAHTWPESIKLLIIENYECAKGIMPFIGHLTNLTAITINCKEYSAENIIRTDVKNLEECTLFGISNCDFIKNSKETLKTLYLSDVTNEVFESVCKLDNLKSLSILNSQNIKLTNMNRFVNLTSIYVNDCDLASIDSLIECKYLEEAGIMNNNIRDISVIANLPNISIVEFQNNMISDISVLKDQKQIIYLSVTSNNISNIDVVKNMANIELLHIEENCIEDISPIENLEKLDEITMDDKLVFSSDTLTKVPNFTNVNKYSREEYLKRKSFGLFD